MDHTHATACTGRRRFAALACLPLLALLALNLWCAAAMPGAGASSLPSDPTTGNSVYAAMNRQADADVIAANRKILLRRLDRWERRATEEGDGSITLRRSELRYIRRVVTMTDTSSPSVAP